MTMRPRRQTSNNVLVLTVLLVIVGALIVATIAGAVWLYFDKEWVNRLPYYEGSDQPGLLYNVAYGSVVFLGLVFAGVFRCRRQALADSAGTRLSDVADQLAKAVRASEKSARDELLGDLGNPTEARLSLVKWAPHEAIDCVPCDSQEIISQYCPGLADTSHSATKDQPAVIEWGKRLVILGEPGSGKTVLALELLLKLHEERAKYSAKDGEVSPVPVRFALPSWQPNTKLYDWMSAELSTRFTGLACKDAERLVDQGLIFPIFDGLDELDTTGGVTRAQEVLPKLRDAVTYDGSKLGMVVTCRKVEYEELIKRRITLCCPNRVVLKPIRPDAVIEYIEALGTNKEESVMVPEWLALLDDEQSGPTLLEIFANPWQLTLGATFFQAVGQPGSAERTAYVDQLRYRHEDGSKVKHKKRVRELLLDGFIPGRLAMARRATAPRFTRRHNDSDLQQKQHHNAVAANYDDKKVTTALTTTATQLAGEVNLVPWSWLRDKRVNRLRGIMASAPIFAISMGFVVFAGFHTDWSLGIVFVGIVPALGCLSLYKEVSSGPAKPGRLAMPSHRELVFWLVFGLVVGATLGLSSGLRSGLTFGLTFGLVSGLTFGLVPLLMRGSAVANHSSELHTTGPATTLKVDLMFWLVFGLMVGLLFGLMVGLVVGSVVGSVSWSAIGLPPGLASWSAIGLPPGLAFGLISGVMSGLTLWLMLGLAGSATAVYWATALVGWRKYGLPLRFVRFAEAMRAVGIFRVAGSAYQFRHRELQDYLVRKAAKETPSVQKIDVTALETVTVDPPKGH